MVNFDFEHQGEAETVLVILVLQHFVNLAQLQEAIAVNPVSGDPVLDVVPLGVVPLFHHLLVFVVETEPTFGNYLQISAITFCCIETPLIKFECIA